jgi:hypothetical protein
VGTERGREVKQHHEFRRRFKLLEELDQDMGSNSLTACFVEKYSKVAGSWDEASTESRCQLKSGATLILGIRPEVHDLRRINTFSTPPGLANGSL